MSASLRLHVLGTPALQSFPALYLPLRFSAMDLKLAVLAVFSVYAFSYVSAAETFRGDASYNIFSTPSMGACEVSAKEPQLVASINAEQFGQFSRARDSPWCKRCVMITAPKFKKSVKVKIFDRSGGKKGSLVLSRAAFSKLASPDEGRISITWNIVPC